MMNLVASLFDKLKRPVEVSAGTFFATIWWASNCLGASAPHPIGFDLFCKFRFGADTPLLSSLCCLSCIAEFGTFATGTLHVRPVPSRCGHGQHVDELSVLPLISPFLVLIASFFIPPAQSNQTSSYPNEDGCPSRSHNA